MHFHNPNQLNFLKWSVLATEFYFGLPLGVWEQNKLLKAYTVSRDGSPDYAAANLKKFFNFCIPSA